MKPHSKHHAFHRTTSRIELSRSVRFQPSRNQRRPLALRHERRRNNSSPARAGVSYTVQRDRGGWVAAYPFDIGRVRFSKRVVAA